jgi:ribulose-phosphate 3-epimerase
MLPSYQETAGRRVLCPSLLSADFAALGEAVEQVADAADMIHVDVMDGHFVPNLTIGPPVVAALRRRSKLPLDVHLMIENPMQWVTAFAESGADSLVIHAEACPHLLRGLQQIREAGCTTGVAINPGTPLSAIEEALPYVDMVLLMTVNPGFGGQIRRLRQLLDHLDNPVHLQIDGGVHSGNIHELYQAGADMIVVGNAAYGTPDPAAALLNLRACAG